MKKVFETKDKVEAECLAGKLEDECLETKLEQNAGKYELYVDENVYDEALLQIENLEYDLPKIIYQNKAKSNNTSSEYEKDSFLYAVEKFFQLKYKHLLLISLIFALIYVLPFDLLILSSIKKMDSEYKPEYDPFYSNMHRYLSVSAVFTDPAAHYAADRPVQSKGEG